jgi:hypothetical protein
MKLYRSYLVCIIYYGYDRQHNNKTGYLLVKTKTDVESV